MNSVLRWRVVRQLSTGNQSTAASRTHINDDRLSVRLTWTDEKESVFDSAWLRHQCQCPLCLDASSLNRLAFPGDLAGADLRLADATLDTASEQVSVHWRDGHVGRFAARWLRKHCYSDWARLERSAARVPPTWSVAKPAQPFCLASHTVDYADYMHDLSALWQAMRVLNRSGLLRLTNVPTTTSSSSSSSSPPVARVAERIAYLRETSYGRTFDVRSVANAENLAYTSLGLEMHADLQYYCSPPGLQLLHCVRFDAQVRGGLSRFVDGFDVLADFRRRHADDFRLLSTAKATYHKIDAVRRFHMRRTVIDTDEFGHPSAIHFSPQFEGPVDLPRPLVADYLAAYFRFASFVQQAPAFEYRMQPGDLFVFNNHRVLHARSAFESASDQHVRHLQGTYLDLEEFSSRFRLLCAHFHHGDADAEPLYHGSAF